MATLDRISCPAVAVMEFVVGQVGFEVDVSWHAELFSSRVSRFTARVASERYVAYLAYKCICFVSRLTGLPQMVVRAQLPPPPGARLLLAPGDKRLQGQLYADQSAQRLDGEQVPLTSEYPHLLARGVQLGHHLLPRKAAAHVVGLLI